MGGIRALAATRAQQTSITEVRKQGVEQAEFGLSIAQTVTELAQDRRVEASSIERKGEQVLPVDATSNGVSSLVIGETFGKLEDDDDGQAGRVNGGTAAGLKQVTKVGTSEQIAEGVSDAQVGMAFGEGSASDTRSIVGHKRKEWGIERHGLPPARAFCIDT